MNSHKLVDDYIQAFGGETQDRLTIIRSLIRESAPDAIEDFAYQMPAYKLHDKPLVYFAGYTHHIGFYATPNSHKAFEKEFSQYKQGKGSVQFPHDMPLPLALIQKVIAFRVKSLEYE